MQQFNPHRPPVLHDLEVIDRCAAVRDLLAAIVEGRIFPDHETLDHLAGILNVAKLHAFAADRFQRGQR